MFKEELAVTLTKRITISGIHGLSLYTSRSDKFNCNTDQEEALILMHA